MIKFDNKLSSQSQILTIFVDENFNYQNRALLGKSNLAKIDSFIKKYKSQKKKHDIVAFDLSEHTKCFIIKNKQKSLENNDIIDIGGKFLFEIDKYAENNTIDIFFGSLKLEKNNLIKFSLEFIHGIQLKSYSFEKYKSSKKKNIIKNFRAVSQYSNQLKNGYKKFESIEKGVFLARDLVSEPPNILNPKRYVDEIKKLSKIGLKITVYNEVKMKKLGMNALLGVGQGSKNESFLVSLEWNGDKKNKKKPLAFVGKGVCFDTGGISLKPARFMEEMKYDMAGSAAVVGLLKTLALRKAKTNAVGVVGLVENMPGSNAQRPGDIVKSFSGKTIEVLNTDAEGRLVLADAISFTEKKFKPKFIIDLATLTGAIIVSLGEEFAGMFSNNDELCKKIYNVSKKVDEKVWRLPLHKNYNKLMNSNIADVQNINYAGGAGSITAAEFLQRFILNKTPWVHLDIAGMAFSKKAANLNPGGATGFGVRLLDKLVSEYFETR